MVLQVSVMSPPGRPVILTPQGGHAGTVTVAAGEEIQLQCVSSGGRPAAEVVYVDSRLRRTTFAKLFCYSDSHFSTCEFRRIRKLNKQKQKDKLLNTHVLCSLLGSVIIIGSKSHLLLLSRLFGSTRVGRRSCPPPQARLPRSPARAHSRPCPCCGWRGRGRGRGRGAWCAR